MYMVEGPKVFYRLGLAALKMFAAQTQPAGTYTCMQIWLVSFPDLPMSGMRLGSLFITLSKHSHTIEPMLFALMSYLGLPPNLQPRLLL